MRLNRTVLLAACLALIGAAHVFGGEEKTETPRLTVHGEAELRVPADQLRLTVEW